ncbi:MAG: hypothetical protein RLZZ292_2828 [Bacteroidota bacterium]|jgi:tetratricopeptide (TPR) repeat protein
MQQDKYIEIIEQARRNSKAKGLFLTNNDIEAYAKGSLDAETSAILEARVARDADFASEVAAEKAIAQGIRSYITAKEEADGVHGAVFEGKERKRAREQESVFEERTLVQPRVAKVVALQSYRWAVAATLLFCVLGLGWLYTSTRFELQSYLNAEKHNVHSSARGYDGTVFEEIKKAVEAEQYQKALTLIKGIREDEKDEEVLFLEGFCHQYLKNNQAAVVLFEQIVQDTEANISTKEQAQYHLALCYAALGQKEKASLVLQRIINDADKNNPYIEKANQFFKELK